MQLIIIGSHRSGTSVVSRLINMLGAYIAPDKLIMPPKPDNPKGFWERTDVVDLNDEILAASNATWDNPIEFDHNRIPTELSSIFSDRIQQIIYELNAHLPWVVKDPRMCLTLPLWLHYLKEPIIISCYRNPIQIAKSLRKRNNFPLYFGLALWETYTVAALNNSANLPKIVVKFDNILKDPAAEVSNLYEKLSQLNVNGLQIPQAKEVSAFVDRSLFHEQNGAGLYSNDLTPRQERLARSLEQVSSPEEPKSYHISPISREILSQHKKSLKKIFDKVSSLEEENINHQIALEIVKKESETRALHLETANGLLEEQTAEIKARNDERLALLQEIHVREEYMKALRYWLQGLDEALTNTFLSWRWKVGHTTISLVEKLLLRGKVTLAKDHALNILEDFKSYNPTFSDIDLASLSAYRNPTGQEKPLSKEEFAEIKLSELNDFLSSNQNIEVPVCQTPKISILLVLFNRAELTLACLQSIINKADADFEVIIIDNNSTDQTAELLKRVQGTEIVCNPENVNFLKACNQGAKLAKGEYLLFLNNDAQLLTGSIKTALNTFATDSRIGAVGGKILLLDGRLQEAGNIIWQDGSCLGYGRGETPFAPEYMFRRDVDYCSGAFLLTKTKLFHELGGFDQAYLPAYYEETDFCMRLTEAGYRIVYEPNAMIVHFEFASSATSDKAITLQKKHKQIFEQKHRQQLQKHFKSDIKHLLKARFSAAADLKKLLYIDDRVPHTSFGSGFPRSNFMLNALVRLGYQVTLLPLNFPAEDQWETAYSDIAPEIEIMLGCGRSGFEDFFRKRTDYYDVLFVSRPHNIEFINHILEDNPEVTSRVQLIYDAEAIFSIREKTARALAGKPLSDEQLQKMINEEIKLSRNADVVLSVSQQESEIFKAAGHDKTYVLGHAVTPNPTHTPFEQRSNILFVGNLDEDKSPNVDSLEWFTEEIFPVIQKSIQGIELHVVGSNNSRRVKALASNAVRLFGRVDNIETFYADSRIFIAPTRFSAGIPLKILEAAAYGIPVAATDILIEQLGWKKGKDISGTAVDDPTSFAKACITLYSDENMWLRIRNNSLNRVRTECSQESNTEVLRTALLT